ncbi:MAG: hypothetical protein HWE39_14955 [Oceanospirillaceae bacterium]|nr:hypothetical protein [Oceanospirillaceae bacterium]
MYNRLGGYTVGQVFNDPEPSNANPANSQFIDGALVMKILFAEYDPAAVIGPEPLANAPAWQIQDPLSASNATFEVRLIQLDIAVKDPRSMDTGWVFVRRIIAGGVAADAAARLFAAGPARAGKRRGARSGESLPCPYPPEHLPDAAERRLMAAVRRGEIARDEIEDKSVRAPLAQPIRLEQGLPVWSRAGMQPDNEALEYYPGR